MLPSLFSFFFLTLCLKFALSPSDKQQEADLNVVPAQLQSEGNQDKHL